MSETLTSKELAHYVARSDEPENLKAASIRIQHWASSGLLDAALGMRPEQRSVGRGKSRAFPMETRFWCALLSDMADQGLGVVDMVLAAQYLQTRRAGFKMKHKPDLVGRAMRGEGGDVYFIMSKLGSSDPGQTIFGLHHAPRRLFEAPATVDQLGEKGHYFNLTKIFGRVRG